MGKIIGSIVVFNPNLDLLETTIQTFLKSAPGSKVYLWDNSASDKISQLLYRRFKEEIVYLKSPGNYGYGRGHNEVFLRIQEDFKYFCILNPDLELNETTIPRLTAYLDTHPEKGLVTGLIVGKDGEIHKVHKLLPSFIDYIRGISCRLLKLPEPPVKTIDLQAQIKPFSLPILSGCFMLFKKEHYQELGGFDNNFFLYFEDYDLSLRSFLKNGSIIIPDVHIVHQWSRESRRNWKLFFTHIMSGLHFYKKWGFSSRLSRSVNSLAQNPSPQKIES